jgi:hypothetical protein
MYLLCGQFITRGTKIRFNYNGKQRVGKLHDWNKFGTSFTLALENGQFRSFHAHQIKDLAW